MANEKPTCEFYEICPFFQSTLAGMPSTANLIKKDYCYADYRSCARYIVTIEAGEEHVSDSLYPNNVKMAQKVIQKVKGEDKDS